MRLPTRDHREVVQELFEAEMSERLGAAPHERSAAHNGHRNGHESRKHVRSQGQSSDEQPGAQEQQRRARATP
jgi:hypothetical protein